MPARVGVRGQGGPVRKTEIPEVEDTKPSAVTEFATVCLILGGMFGGLYFHQN